MEWISALRLSLAAMMIILVLLAHKWGGGDLREGIWPALLVAMICAATMAQNNLRDRHHDIHKGRWLAWNKPVEFRRFVIGVWALSAVIMALLLWLGRLTYAQSCVCLIGALVGLTYSETRRIPLLPMLLVQTSVALPIFFGVIGLPGSPLVWYLLIMVWLVIGYREILCDLHDREFDVGWKQTLPVIAGERAAIFAGIMLLSIAILWSFLLPLGLWFLVTALVSLLIFVNGKYRGAKWVLDIGFVSYMLYQLCL